MEIFFQEIERFFNIIKTVKKNILSIIVNKYRLIL